MVSSLSKSPVRVTDVARLGLSMVNMANQALAIPGVGILVGCLTSLLDILDSMKVRKAVAQSLKAVCSDVLERCDVILCDPRRKPEDMEISVAQLARKIKLEEGKLVAYARLGYLRQILGGTEIEQSLTIARDALSTWLRLEIFSYTANTYASSSRIEDRMTDIEADNKRRHNELKKLWAKTSTVKEEDFKDSLREEIMEFVKFLHNDPEVKKEFREDPDLQTRVYETCSAEARRLDVEVNMTSKDVATFRKLLQELAIPDSVDIIQQDIMTEDKPTPVDSSNISEATWKGKKIAYKKFTTMMDGKRVTSNIRRFTRETHVFSGLRHKNIVTFYGVVRSESDALTYLGLVTAWQDNGNMLQFIRKNPESAHRLELMSSAAKGLEFLHSKGVFHGNVKCSNILVNDRCEAMITDFAFSHIVGFKTEWSVAETHSAPAGTRWLAPERMRSEPPTEHSDVYSLAMCILEAVTLQPPFSEMKGANENQIESIVCQTGKSKSPLHTRRPQRPSGMEGLFWIEDEMWELMMLCWADLPQRRPSMSYVCTQLQRASRAHDLGWAFMRDVMPKDGSKSLRLRLSNVSPWRWLGRRLTCSSASSGASSWTSLSSGSQPDFGQSDEPEDIEKPAVGAVAQ